MLGRDYGGDPAKLEHVHAVLDDLARHPGTTRHTKVKLAMHFVADVPPAPLVDAMAQAYLVADTGLLPV